MRHSCEKRRDMARSILPSRSRWVRKDLARIRRRARRNFNQHLAAARTDPEGLPLVVDPRAYPDAEIRRVVRERRAADKLKHLERWAVRVTADVPHHERLGMMRALLPGGLIGDHAMSHLARLPELNPHQPPRQWHPTAWARGDEARLPGLRDALVTALEDGRHRELNQAMKRAAVGDPPQWRTLAGVHDVDAFVYDVMHVARWSAALEAFVAHTRGTSPRPTGK